MSYNTNEKTKLYYQNTIGLLLLVLLMYALYNVLSAFFGVFAFAIIFAVSFSSLFEKMVKWFGNKRKIAAFVYGLLLVAVVAVPFTFLIGWLTDTLHNVRHFMNNIDTAVIPALPDSVAGIPVVGEKIAAIWAQLQANPKATFGAYEPQIMGFLKHMLSSGAGVAGAGLELIVGIIISAVLLTGGKSSVQALKQVLNEIAGTERGDAIVDASGKAIKGVAVGVMGTAFIEAIFMWLGLYIAKVPLAGLLVAVTFLMAVVQLGPLLVAIPVTIWLGSQGETGYAIFMGVWTVLLIVIDNVVKPILIGKSGKLPILVLFLGVVGGMAAWGFTGMFKGAILLSVGYTLFNSWFSHNNGKAQAPVAAQ